MLYEWNSVGFKLDKRRMLITNNNSLHGVYHTWKHFKIIISGHVLMISFEFHVEGYFICENNF